MIGQLIGNYRLVRQLGAGGMGSVWEAVHQHIGKRAAVKLLHPHLSRNPNVAERFFNEARAVNLIQHTGIVNVFEFGTLESGAAYIVMEHLGGETLGDRIERLGRLDVGGALRLGRQVASALHAAHRAGIVHRDLKPDNVMIVPEPETSGGERAKLLDFGIAKLAEDCQLGPEGRLAVTRTGVTMGTPVYMAPEQARGARGIDAKADVYSLGVMLYEALAGRPPFQAESAVDLILMHVREQPPPLRELDPRVSEGLAALIHAMLAKPPKERPSMAEVVASLEELGAPRASATLASVPPDGSDRSETQLPGPRPAALGSAGAGEPALSTTPTLQRPAKPSILVLPFTNMSGDPEQEFFSDGLTEDVITELSRFHELFVISRNTAFKYKGQTVEVQKVARELGVHYVIEGSVRKAGNRVRVTVQLIDGEADRHVWAERYDRNLEDIFAIQDELTSAIAARLSGRVEAASRERASRKTTETMAAYECVLAGKLLHHRATRADNVNAMQLMERAIALDPNYAHAHAWKACILGQAWRSGWVEDPAAAEKGVEDELTLALTLDENDSDVHRILASLNLIRNNHEKALCHQQRALDLNSNDDLIIVQHGEILTWLGRAEEGIEWIRKAMRLNPDHPARFWSHLGRAYFVARRYPEAIEAFQRIGVLDHTHHASLAACYAQLGEARAAEEHVREALRRAPAFTVTGYLSVLHYKHERDLAHHRDSLLKAGLPA